MSMILQLILQYIKEFFIPIAAYYQGKKSARAKQKEEDYKELKKNAKIANKSVSKSDLIDELQDGKF